MLFRSPLLVAADGRRLSKREKDLDLAHLRKTRSAQEIIGLLAYAAGLIEAPFPVTPQELLPDFRWSKITKENIPIFAAIG